ncbi:Carboxypeptidase A1, partial [Durusdinium trenchii]
PAALAGRPIVRMKHVLVVVALGTAIAAKVRLQPASESLPPFYHTSEELREELQHLVSTCPELTLKTHWAPNASFGRSVQLDVISIKAKDAGAKKLNKVFMLFGEHARELISAESGLHFAKTLCGERKEAILRGNEFMMVINANPESRSRVEKGEWCLRVNPNGVDLNRNWDEHWEGDASFGKDTNPGETPFSEPETQLLKQLVSAYRPTTFFTIHSGTLGMYMPWAFDMQHLADRNQQSMMEILKKVDEDHCQCPFGAAGKEVGYSCPGTCLDWVFDQLKTPYCFAYEIYYGGSLSQLRDRWQDKLQWPGASLLQEQNLAHEHFKDLFAHFLSSFIQVASQAEQALQELNELQGAPSSVQDCSIRPPSSTRIPRRSTVRQLKIGPMRT